jgi:DNA-binding IclR family transcriptional regulator
LHCTSNGKVLLAFMREDARDRLLAEPLPRLTPRTITDPERLRAQLTEIRARGYAQTMDELEEGLNAVAAPIRGMNGDLIAALSVSGPASGCGVSTFRGSAATAEAAAVVSRRLGHVDRGVPPRDETRRIAR